MPLASEGEEGEEAGGKEGEAADEEEEEEQNVLFTAQEACRVAADWTHPLLPRPPQPVQPSSGHSIRDSWPFSVCCWWVG